MTLAKTILPSPPPPPLTRPCSLKETCQPGARRPWVGRLPRQGLSPPSSPARTGFGFNLVFILPSDTVTCSHQLPVLLSQPHAQTANREHEGADGEDQRPVEVIRRHSHEQQGGRERDHERWANQHLGGRTVLLKKDQAEGRQKLEK